MKRLNSFYIVGRNLPEHFAQTCERVKLFPVIFPTYDAFLKAWKKKRSHFVGFLDSIGVSSVVDFLNREDVFDTRTFLLMEAAGRNPNTLSILFSLGIRDSLHLNLSTQDLYLKLYENRSSRPLPNILKKPQKVDDLAPIKISVPCRFIHLEEDSVWFETSVELKVGQTLAIQFPRGDAIIKSQIEVQSKQTSGLQSRYAFLVEGTLQKALDSTFYQGLKTQSTRSPKILIVSNSPILTKSLARLKEKYALLLRYALTVRQAKSQFEFFLPDYVLGTKSLYEDFPTLRRNQFIEIESDAESLLFAMTELEQRLKNQKKTTPIYLPQSFDQAHCEILLEGTITRVLDQGLVLKTAWNVRKFCHIRLEEKPLRNLVGTQPYAKVIGSNLSASLLHYSNLDSEEMLEMQGFFKKRKAQTKYSFAPPVSAKERQIKKLKAKLLSWVYVALVFIFFGTAILFAKKFEPLWKKSGDKFNGILKIMIENRHPEGRRKKGE